jgi:tetratricopeptide (TPR) repeat protein
VTSTTDAEGRFLEDAPAEIKDVLDWQVAGRAQRAPGQDMTEFAGKFLDAIHDDGAVIPETSAVSAPQMLALVLLHHRRSPESPGAWLNIGLALRRMSLCRPDDPEHIKRRRLQCALEAFERSLHLEPENNGKNIRAWTGKAFTYHQLGSHGDEVRCCLRALDADRSDPKLWLFYGFALQAAGRKKEALSIIDNAYEAYVMAGRPEELRDVFAGVQSALTRHQGFHDRGL